MSRVFLGPASEGSVQSVRSDAVVSAYSFSAWINISDFSNEGIVLVKDPVGSYFTYMTVGTDGSLFGEAGLDDLGGIGSFSIGAAGTGYNVNDTGFVTGGNPDQPGNEAQYIVQAVDGSHHVTQLGGAGAGQGYANGNTYPTVTGGNQPGTGSGLTIHVTGLINQSNASSQSIEKISLNTWTHVAMTWDSSGDGLVHLYINGVECTYDPTGERTTSSQPDTSTGPTVIGDDLNDFTLTGSVAEVAVFGQTALTAPQVLSIKNSTTGVPSALQSVLTDYWHLCGLTSPEPNAKSPTNTGTVTNAAKGANSPGYTGCVISIATAETVCLGQYGGKTIAQAFYNPSHYDLIQVLNEGGSVVWNLDYLGNTNVNPGSATQKALVASFFGASFAVAIYNPLNLDIFQIVGPGDIVHFWVDSSGNSHTA